MALPGHGHEYISKLDLFESLGMIKGEMLNFWPDELDADASEFERMNVMSGLETLRILCDGLASQVYHWGEIHHEHNTLVKEVIHHLNQISLHANKDVHKINEMQVLGEGHMSLAGHMEEIRKLLKSISSLIHNFPE
ncbi:MAG: hypothetical protein MRY21_06165 [Simkaniaceae bacterium]|nr:hypothetical protein [Simkaniaceae bacterium]